MPSPGENHTLLVLVEDLFFTSRIEAAAEKLGIPVEIFETGAGWGDDAPIDRKPESGTALLDAARSLRPYLIVVDLDAPRVGGLSAILHLAADSDLSQIPVIAFGSHVNAELLRAAREAGARQSLAKSRFVSTMGDLFQRYLP